MNISNEIKNAIAAALSDIVSDFEISGEKIFLEYPDKADHGEYSSNVAMGLYRDVSGQFKSPREFAQKIIEKLQLNENLMSQLDKIEIAGPGFINFHLNNEYFMKLLKLIIADIDAFAKPKQVKSKVSIEHTDMNPNKDLHVGHLRNSCLGDSLVRLLRYSGRDVTVQYYQNDAGLQIASVVLAYKENFIDPAGYEKMHKWAADAYVDVEKRLEDNPELIQKRDEIQMNISLQDNEDSKLARYITEEILRNVLETMVGFNIYFDLVVCESSIIENKLWEETFELLKKNKAFYKATEGDKAGCWLISMPNAEDKVFVRSNGIPNYVATDFAYELWKFGLLQDFKYEDFTPKFYPKSLMKTAIAGKEIHGFNQADEVYLVVDTTQSYPQQSIIEALKVLGYKKEAESYHHVAYGFVYLSQNTAEKLNVKVENPDKPIKMSGRKGTVVSVDKFVKEVEKNLIEKFGQFESLSQVREGAIKFELLKSNTYQDMVFDLDSATDNKGFTGPYIQYTYARAISVIKKSSKTFEQIKQIDLSNQNFELDEVGILRLLLKFPDKIELALAEAAPHYLCHYMYELCQGYNAFYNSNKIIGTEQEALRLSITWSVAKTLQRGLDLIGISSPDSV